MNDAPIYKGRPDFFRSLEIGAHLFFDMLPKKCRLVGGGAVKSGRDRCDKFVFGDAKKL